LNAPRISSFSQRNITSSYRRSLSSSSRRSFSSSQRNEKCCPQILIVDDNEFNIQALSFLLESMAGVASDIAMSGR
jgi:PleD family two-component response regulator